jgi:hypothetical protein
MTNNNLDPRLAELLNDLKSVPARDPRAAARGKNKFLAEAVSLSENRRHSWWTTIFQQKEKFAMNLIVSTLVIVGLLFGGNATVAAAQDDLPTGALYQIKLLSEDAQLFFNTDPATEVDLLMQQAQTRTEEMAALNSMGITPPAALTTRAQDRIDQALQVTSTLDETEVTDTLLLIRDRLQTQDRLLDKLQDGTCTDCEPILDQTRDMLRLQLNQVADGLADPQGFVYRHRNQMGVATAEPTEVPVTDEPTEVATEVATEDPVATEEPLATESPVVTPQVSCTPVLDGTGLQNGSMGTPEPQNGNQEQPQEGGGDNQPDAPAEPQQNGPENGSGQQNGGQP